MKELSLTGKKYLGQHALVDDEDFAYLNQWKWHCAGDPRTKYAVRTQYERAIDPETGEVCERWAKIRMHTEIMKPPAGMFVDHVNGNGLDNRRGNLRIVTHRQNMANRKTPRTNSSGYVGVQKSGNRWRATVFIEGKITLLGVYGDPAEAARVRDAAALKVYGRFARLNFPETPHPECPVIEVSPTYKRHRLSDEARKWANTPMYWSWQHMHGRCSNKRSKDWPNYGGRGITVCDRWRSFDNFVEDMAEGFVAGVMSLDRIDVNGNYEPSNCRWATRDVQNTNRRNVRLVTYDGRTQHLARWFEELNVSKSAVYGHVKAGKSFPEAFDAVRANSHPLSMYELNGKRQSLSEWAKDLGLSRATLEQRLAKGWPLEKVLSSADYRR